MGSEFAYEDISSQELEKYTYKYLRNEDYQGLDCFVVEYDPIDRKSGYSKQIVWIDTKEYRSHKIEFYDRKESLLKTLVYKNYSNIMVNFGERIYSRWKTIKREKRLYWNSTTGSSKLDCLQKTSIRNRLKKFGDGLFCKNIMCLAPTGHTS